MVKQEFDELEGGPSGAGAPTEETPSDEFVWTDEDQGEGDARLPGAQAEPVRLHDLPEFREFQSRSDQRVAALQAELARRDEKLEQLQAEQRTIQDRLDFDKLRNATPQQIHAHYQQRAEREAAEQVVLADGQVLQQQIGGRAAQLLQSLGMDRETPGLRFASKVDWQGYADLLESVLEVQSRAAGGAEGGTTQVAATTEPPEPGAQVGVQTPPATRGRVSTARGRKPTSLWSAYFKALDRLGRGDTHEVVALRKEYEKKGLDFSKMPKRRRR